jgi:hypothetical protein
LDETPAKSSKITDFGEIEKCLQNRRFCNRNKKQSFFCMLAFFNIFDFAGPENLSKNLWFFGALKHVVFDASKAKLSNAQNLQFCKL